MYVTYSDREYNLSRNRTNTLFVYQVNTKVNEPSVKKKTCDLRIVINCEQALLRLEHEPSANT